MATRLIRNNIGTVGFPIGQVYLFTTDYTQDEITASGFFNTISQASEVRLMPGDFIFSYSSDAISSIICPIFNAGGLISSHVIAPYTPS